MTADEMLDLAMENRKQLDTNDVLYLAQKAAKKGQGGLFLKGRVNSKLTSELRDLGYSIASFPVNYEAIGVVTLVSWSM